MAALALALLGAPGLCERVNATSFDCRSPTMPDEAAICADQHLSELDNLIASAYADAEAHGSAVFGEKRKFLRERRGCGQDHACIEAAQIAFLTRFKALGITPSLPSWLQSRGVDTSSDSPALTPGDPAEPGMAASPKAQVSPLHKTLAPFAVKRAGLLVSKSTGSTDDFVTHTGEIDWFRNLSAKSGGAALVGQSARIVFPDFPVAANVSFEDGNLAGATIDYVIKLDFEVRASDTMDDVVKIGMPLSRSDTEPTGRTLSGAQVGVLDNHFLIGVSGGDAASVGVEAPSDVRWFDIVVVFRSGLVGKLTFERPTWKELRP